MLFVSGRCIYKTVLVKKLGECVRRFHEWRFDKDTCSFGVMLNEVKRSEA
jgi:hypothetical protein